MLINFNNVLFAEGWSL